MNYGQNSTSESINNTKKNNMVIYENNKRTMDKLNKRTNE